MRKSLFIFISLVAMAVASPALAQSTGDMDAPAQRRGAARQQATQQEEVVREIERGVFLKANVGTTIYFASKSRLLKPGTTLMLSVGMDVLDKAKASAGWEINIYQAVHNAKFLSYADLPGSDVAPQNWLQGSSYLAGIFVGGGGKAFPLRRLGIGGHAGVGAMFIPRMIQKDAYNSEVVPAWGGYNPKFYNGLPTLGIYAGPELEYYTKLSHFSLGLNIDLVYVLNFDVGMMASGFFKYSF